MSETTFYHQVLVWDPVAEEWGVSMNLMITSTMPILMILQVAAYLSSPRGNHAVAEVPLELLANFC